MPVDLNGPQASDTALTVASKRIALVTGGRHEDREVSEQTVQRVTEALDALGHASEVVELGPQLPEALRRARPDVVFNALQGGRGRSYVQGLLQVLGLPHTHSSVLSASVAANKPMAVAVFRAAGLPCPPGITVPMAALRERQVMPKPFVVKPVEGMGSIGLTVVFSDEDVPPLTDEHRYWSRGDEVLVEAFVPGVDLTVGILGDRALGVMECRSPKRYLDPADRAIPGGYESIMPAPIDSLAYDAAMALALSAHRALRCSGPTRVDLRYDSTQPAQQQLTLLELNAFPGMTPISPYPVIAEHAGLSFPDLVSQIIALASFDPP